MILPPFWSYEKPDVVCLVCDRPPGREQAAEVSAHPAVNSRRARLLQGMEVIVSHFPLAGGAAPEDDQGLEVSFWKTLELDYALSHRSFKSPPQTPLFLMSLLVVLYQRAFLYCKPFLCNAPSTDLVSLLEALLTRRDGTVSITMPGGAAPGARKVIDYCRKNGKTHSA